MLSTTVFPFPHKARWSPIARAVLTTVGICLSAAPPAATAQSTPTSVFHALSFYAPTNGTLICTSGGVTVADSTAPPGCSAGLLKCQGWGDENSMPEGSPVQCVATPTNNHYVLSGWGHDCTSAGTSQTCSLTMDSDKTVSASFAPIVSGSGTTPAGPATLTLSGAGCALNGPPVFSQAPLTGGPAGYAFPFGQIAFKATGCTSGGTLNVSLALPSTPANAVLFKQINGQWAPWSATFRGNTVQFTVTDNNGDSTAAVTGDNDATPGEIDDPVLIALPIQTADAVAPVPSLSIGALALLTLLIAGLGRRRPVQRRGG